MTFIVTSFNLYPSKQTKPLTEVRAMDNKTKVNIKLVQALLDAKLIQNNAEDALFNAEAAAKKAAKEVVDAEEDIRKDSGVRELLVSTGVRTLDNQIVNMRGNVIMITPFAPIPAIWEFIKNV